MLDFPVQETTLDNGLKVLTVEHHEAPITSAWIWYRVGSRNERPGITGISHWTEHMCFKGGIEFGKGDIFKEVAKVGGYNNGMTGADYTVYFETLPSAHAELGLRIEADRMANARFEPEEVASERSVIISEREGAENWPQFLLSEELSLAAFRTHPYRWSVVGWKADLREITHKDLWDYYKACYTPDNAVLVVVGDFETDRMVSDIERLFGGIQGSADVPEIRSVEPPQEGERRIYLRRPGTASYLQIAFHIPAATDEDEPALRVLNSILSGTGPISWMSPSAGGFRTSRIYRALVETELASSAGCGIIPQRIDPGLGTFYATARVGVEPERVEEAMLEVIEQAAGEAPGEDELERAKTQLFASMAYAGESATGIAGLLGSAEMTDTHESVRTLEQRVAAVTAEDVLRVAQGYFAPSNRTLGWFIPTDEPGEGGGGRGPDTSAPPGQGLVFGPSAAGQFQRFFYTGLEIFRNAQRETLDNGLRVVACRSAVTPAVSVRGSIRGGGVLDDDAQAGRARFAATMMQRGTETKSHQEIFEALDAVGATFSIGASLESTSFHGDALAGNLDLLLDTIADVVVNPTFPDEELGKVRTEILTSLRQDDDSTSRVASKEARGMLYPEGHPYHVWESGSEEAIEALSREDLAAYHEGAVRPEEGTIVLVGDVDPDRAIGAVEDKLGDWRPEGEAAAWPDLSASSPDETVTKTTVMPSKTQCDIVIASTGLPRTHPDYYCLDFATQILGRLGFMGRFGETVRDKLGLCYYCMAISPENHGDAMWFAQAGVNPKNVKLATDTMLEQMRLMQEELVSEEEYNDLVQNQLSSLAMMLEAKSKIAGSLLTIERWNLGPDYYERYPDIVRSVSREDIREAARQYFRPEKHVRVVVGPKWEAE